MWEDVVCIAGVNPELECIRPVTDDGVRIWTLYRDGKPAIFPGAKLWFDLSPTETAPPHIEDRTFSPRTVAYKDTFQPRHWETLLRRISYESVQGVFDGYLEERRVAPGAPTRSLGTLRDVTVDNLSAESRYRRIGIRMDFKDAAGVVHTRLPVNDLAFRGFYKSLRSRYRDEDRAARELLQRLKSAARVYLRVGLARPTAIGRYPEACWSQVTGVYTFPDYLEGRTWADFH